MRKKEEIEKLKQAWYRNPCWDLEDSEGFEGHYEELKAFSDQSNKAWTERYEKERAAEMHKMGINSFKAYDYLKSLERRIQILEEHSKNK